MGSYVPSTPAQRREIIDFTIEHNRNTSICRMHGLMAKGRQIHNRQSSLCQSHHIPLMHHVDLFSPIIGATVQHGLIHGL